MSTTNGENQARLEQFKYLGTVINKNASSKNDVLQKRVIGTYWTPYYNNLYAAETLTLNKALKKKASRHRNGLLEKGSECIKAWNHEIIKKINISKIMYDWSWRESNFDGNGHIKRMAGRNPRLGSRRKRKKKADPRKSG